ncbi:hypothetical protein BT96DRAFT_1026679 [Gymnopus androsaceus JB14]|uniref:Uncharacterized protein n=1 Tax=Gymnopus androsaceus JB14 TaxID=1447944 RepID=A0A6A4GIL3_9AGAR|nr:hypothetical protein BT96DRAFT_1026679 [Gymnopus androsaceus JB14]
MLRFQSKPLIGLCVWISIRGGFAVPTSSEFTYVGFGSVLPLNTVDAGSDGVVADTIMLIPAGTESSGNSPATTYLYSEVEQMTTISTGTSTTATLTISESVFGTLVASASGFALSATLYDVDPQGDNVGDEISCHYINSVDGECEQVNTLFTFATTGEAITGTLQESAPTSSGSGSGSNNGFPSHLDAKMLGFQSKPIIGLCTWILCLAIRGGFAVPTSGEFTYVAFGSLPFTTDADLNGVVADTIMLKPVGTETSGDSPATTYLYSEVLQLATISTGTSTTATLTTSETAIGTLVASASGFVFSATIYDADSLGDNIGNEISCHYTDSGSGECVESNRFLIATTTGKAITGTLQEFAPTSSGSDSSGSGSHNGVITAVELNGRMLAMMVMFTAVGTGFFTTL